MIRRHILSITSFITFLSVLPDLTTRSVPSVLGALPKGDDLPELEMITVGGEALPAELADHWRRGRRMINGYGPTEAAIGATLASDWPAGGKPPLGRPLPSVATYVLGSKKELLPIDVLGEFYLADTGIANG